MILALFQSFSDCNHLRLSFSLRPRQGPSLTIVRVSSHQRYWITSELNPITRERSPNIESVIPEDQIVSTATAIPLPTGGSEGARSLVDCGTRVTRETVLFELSSFRAFESSSHRNLLTVISKIWTHEIQFEKKIRGETF